MDSAALREKLFGVIGFPVTPFDKQLEVDLAALRSNLARMLEHPFAAIVAAGGTGELYSLTPAEYQSVVKTVVDVVGGRVPVIAAVGFNTFLASEMARTAANDGADGILGFPPYYPAAEFEGLFNYYKSIANSTSLGMAIYSRDWAVFTPEMVERLTAIPNLVAWKDGQGDMRRYQMIMNRVGNRLRWIGGAGDDLAPSYYRLGIRSYTSSLSNFSPRLALKLHELSIKDSGELDGLMSGFVVPHYDFRSRRKGYEVAVVKAAMDAAGLKGGPVRPPLVDITDDERTELRGMMKSWTAFL